MSPQGTGPVLIYVWIVNTLYNDPVPCVCHGLKGAYHQRYLEQQYAIDLLYIWNSWFILVAGRWVWYIRYRPPYISIITVYRNNHYIPRAFLINGYNIPFNITQSTLLLFIYYYAYKKKCISQWHTPKLLYDTARNPPSF